jgi:hypothetical protein
MDYKNIIYCVAPNQNSHLLSLFLIKCLEELNFLTLFYEQPQYFSKGFLYQ